MWLWRLIREIILGLEIKIDCRISKFPSFCCSERKCLSYKVPNVNFSKIAGEIIQLQDLIKITCNTMKSLRKKLTKNTSMLKEEKVLIIVNVPAL